MDKTAENTLKTWNPPTPVSLSLLETDHPEQKTFTGFAQKWAALSPAVTWETTGARSALPGFALTDNITYSALPLEKELAPFLKGIETLCSPPALSRRIKKMVDRILQPCDLTLYIALQCPHCPVMVDTLFPLAAASNKIRLTIIDGSLFPDQARADQVMAAPCLILDKDFRWTGAVEAEELLSMILDRNPAALSTATLKNILEEGDADWITRKMIGAGEIFKGFIGLLLHETWSVRLGAMVVVEDLAEKAPDLGLALVPVLTAEFEGRDIPVQGDILYALGEIGDLETKAWIREREKAMEHADLKDAAQDAIDTIESRLSR